MKGKTMLNIKVPLPRVHMAGSDAPSNAHLEVGQHGFALFLSPDAQYPVVDIDGTSEQLEEVVRALQTALASRRSSDAERERTVLRTVQSGTVPRTDARVC
jgi:hypothetical protein